MRDRSGADVARGAVANPIFGIEYAQGLGPSAEAVIAEAQPRRAVVFDLGDEMSIRRTAIEQVAHRRPIDFVEIELAVQPRRGQRAARLLRRGGARRAGQWVNVELSLLFFDDKRVASVADRPDRLRSLDRRAARKTDADGLELFLQIQRQNLIV